MKPAEQRKLEAAGFRVADAADFLGLTNAEREVVALRSLANRTRREPAPAAGKRKKSGAR